MGIVVQKYGGSSVADAAGIKRVAQRIVNTRKAGHDVVVVVSAMGDTTDELRDLAEQVTPLPPPRELDMLLTSGERISMALVAMAIAALGHTAKSFTGSQAGVITDSAHGRAKIIDITPGRIEQAIGDGAIAIVAGFQGVSQDTKDITTLGRGASDTTAVALAAALKYSAGSGRSLSRMRRVLLALTSAVALASAAPTLAWAQQASEPTFPDLEFVGSEGGSVRLSELKGNVVLLNVWATWCGPCKKELPIVQRMYDTYSDRNFVVRRRSTSTPTASVSSRS